MGRVILTADSNYNTYMDNICKLVDANADTDVIPTTMIDSIPYMQAIEDELLEEMPDATNQEHSKRNSILRYIMYGTAELLVYKFPPIARESDFQETTVLQVGTLEEHLDILRREKTKAANDLGIKQDTGVFILEMDTTTDHSDKAVSVYSNTHRRDEYGDYRRTS